MVNSIEFSNQETHGSSSKMQSISFLDFASLTKTFNFNLPSKLDTTVELEYFISSLKTPYSNFLEPIDSIADSADEPRKNEAFLAWNRSDQLLLCWLLSTVSKSVMGQVHRVKISLEFWHIVERLYS
ncbi:hypothetical protein ACOSQ3_019826 [Xanthoceras sorbifolium]